MAKRITSRQKQKTHGNKNNLTAKEKDSRQKEKPRPHGIEESVGAGESSPGAPWDKKMQ